MGEFSKRGHSGGGVSLAGSRSNDFSMGKKLDTSNKSN